jgi:hypothetical protein
MTPAAKAALVTAQMHAQALTPRITGALVRASLASTPDPVRLDYLRDAKEKAAQITQLILVAEAQIARGQRSEG